MNPSSVPPALWSDDEIEYREDGYLYVKDEEKSEEQPLLLSSTETLLKALYPSMSRESMLFQGKGHQAPGDPLLNEILGPSLVESEGNLISTQDTPMGMEQGKGEASNEEMDVDEASGEAMAVDDVDAKKDPKPAANDEKGEGKKKKNNKPKIPPEYSAYQNLTRVDNLGNKVQSALLDIQFCRHRNRREQNRERISRDQAKVRALEHQQQRLLSQRSESTGENSVASGDEDEGDGDQQNEAAGEDGFRESPTIRLARTINSIRALCPHLLPILNHPRRNDRQLVIRKTNYKSKKKAMCWLLGTQGFDTTTRKTCINAHKDVLNILESFISADDAQQIADDPLGAPDFWPNQWIQQIVKRATPKIQNPLTILSERGYAVGEIKTVALECDKLLNKDGAEGNTHDIQQRYHTAVERLHQRLVKLLTDRFPNARVSIYGSCLSNLSLGKGADVDLSLWIPEAERLKTAFHDGEIEASVYEKDMKRFVYQVFHKFKNLQREFRGMQPITRARVPVVKGTYNFAHNPYSSDGSINFDICFLNDIAVANSGLLREYSLVDSHVRKLMMSVKQWAKDYKMNSAKDNSISSYAWINLVVFYLQCLGSVPNLQSQEMMDAVGLVRRPEENYWHFVNKLDTCTIRWDQIKGAKAWTMPSDLQDMPVSALLYGFFEFYSRRFPSAIFAISIKRGNISLPRLAFKKRSLFFCIEDPFETFDSHCPHDLGTPASESATRDILKFFREAEAHLRDVLCGKKNDKGLWPDPPFVEPQSPRDNSKHPRYSHFQSPDNNARRSQEPNQVSGVQPGHVVQQEERGGGEKKMQQTNQYSRRGRNGRQSNQKRRPPPKQNEKNKGQSDDLNERPIQAAAPKEKHNDESSIHMEASRQNNQKGNGNSKSSGKKKGQSNVPKVQAAVPNDSHNNGSRNHKEASRQNDQNGKGNPKSHEGGDGNKKADGKKNYTGPNRRRRPRNQKGNASNQNFQTQST